MTNRTKLLEAQLAEAEAKLSRKGRAGRPRKYPSVEAREAHYANLQRLRRWRAQLERATNPAHRAQLQRKIKEVQVTLVDDL